MKDCGLTCKDCGGDIEYFDVAFHDGTVTHENLYWCDRCDAWKENDSIMR